MSNVHIQNTRYSQLRAETGTFQANFALSFADTF